MSTIFLEAFGQLSGLATIDTREEDLHSVFRERAALMRWATTTNNRPLLWWMEEAEITADTDPCRIGWAQVGVNGGAIMCLSHKSCRHSGCRMSARLGTGRIVDAASRDEPRAGLAVTADTR